MEDSYAILLETPSGILSSQKFKDEAEAKALLDKCLASGKLVITKTEKKEKQEKAPTLFDLTSLQREANRKLGYTAQQTLDYTQALYEKKLVSYPRTDSRFLTEDMEEILPSLVIKASQICGLQPTKVQNLHAVINGKKVTDHHAIIPTNSSDKVGLSELPTGEREILKLIAGRLLEAISSPCAHAETVLEAECADEAFSAKGKTILNPGWKSVVGETDKSTDDKEERLTLTGSEKAGGEIQITNGSIKAGKTTPPKSYTEDTLLSAMEKAGSDEIPDEAERKGLGTPATRAGIIEKLVRIGFIERRGDKKTKYLVPTHKGEALITVIPEEIQSASMTAQWEKKLLEIEKESYDFAQFMGEIERMIKELIETYEIIPDAEVLMKPIYAPVGKCPRCGKSVEEKTKGYFCSNRECKFALWKENRFFDSLSKKLTKQIAEELLRSGKANLRKCRSAKTGKTFDTTIVLTTDDNGQARFALEFAKKR